MLPVESKVSFRLTPEQVGAIRPGFQEIVDGYNAWRKTKQYPHARLLYIHALSERQLAGRFDQRLMEEILALVADVNSNSSSGRREAERHPNSRSHFCRESGAGQGPIDGASHAKRNIADTAGFRYG